MHRGRLAAMTAALLALGACSASMGVRSDTVSTAPGTTTPAPTSPGTTTPGAPTTAAPRPTASLPEVPAPEIDWFECGSGTDCGSIEVPFDYADPAAGTMTLRLVRARATSDARRVGSLLVNPGGPGFGGTFLAASADFYFTATVREHFDVVAWDPRGTGDSEPAIDCIDEFDPYVSLDITPDDATERQALVDAARRFAQACAERNGDLLGHVSTVETARDMDLIRRALGEATISYFGFSYGSELGAVWASMFPATVRAAVLDGAVDPAATGIQGAIDQAKGFELALNAFLAHCDRRCAFTEGGDAGEAFDRILADIDANAYPTERGRPALTQGIAYIGVIEALYSQDSWPDLADALEAARTGDGSGLLALYDDYFQRRPDGTYANSLEAFLAITCLDDPGPSSLEGVDEYNDDFVAAAPRIGPSFTHSYTCVDWPAPPAPRVTVDGRGAGPIIVIGTTNDPATPYETSLRMARALEQGIFVTVRADGHLGYLQSECAQDVVDRYLVDLEVPPADVECD